MFKKVFSKRFFSLMLVLFTIIGCFGVNDNLEKQNSDSNQDILKRSVVINGLQTDYGSMYYRGTSNNWGATKMDLVFDYVWKTKQTFTAGTLGKFKFDVNANWQTNFGDNNVDGIADPSGTNIAVAGGKTYKIYFYEKTKEYYVGEEGTLLSHFANVYFRGTPNGWAADRFVLVDDFQWQIDTTFNINGDNKFKFDIYGDWTKSFGDANLDGFADYTYNSILLTTGLGKYKITFNDWNKKYDLKLENSNTELYIGPYLTWNDTAKPHNGIVVNYVYKGSSRSKIMYGLSKDNLTSSTSYITNTNNNYHVKLSLSANTTYFYKVAFENGESTKTYSFKTALENDPSFSYIVLGDMQDNGTGSQRWSDIVNNLSSQNFDFIIGVGDMIMDNTESDWKVFFDKGKEIFASKVLMPVAGNHDTPTYSSSSDLSSFKNYFDLPKYGNSDGTYYGFKYGDAYFMALSSETRNTTTNGYTSFEDGGLQYDWVEKRLEENKNTKWLFSYYHIPSFNASTRHVSSQYEVREIAELFNNSLDWAFGGHVHMYQRSKPIKYYRYGTGTQVQSSYNSGVGYIVVPPAGNYPDGSVSSTEAYRLASSAVEIGFVKVDINNNNININSYGLGTLSNSVSLHKLENTISYTKTNETRKKHDQVYLRGTFNNWGNKAMTLVDDYTWEATENFNLSSNNRFKFDIYGDWIENYGEDNFDFVSDKSGASIKLASSGIYKIRYNDLTKKYTITLQ